MTLERLVVSLVGGTLRLGNTSLEHASLSGNLKTNLNQEIHVTSVLLYPDSAVDNIQIWDNSSPITCMTLRCPSVDNLVSVKIAPAT